ncbi:MAG TPA: SRPBCC family protein [Polyangiaceae bacterium]|nr:SRPBCC family protein [Polyangiaceae bacterium]
MIVVLVVIVAVVVGLWVVVSRRPDSFRYQREITIPRPATVVFPLIDELRAWQGWSPWEGLDPALERTYEGPAAGVGARYGWKSAHRNVGEGRMEIVESRSPQTVVLSLEFIAPFAAKNVANFELSEKTGSTRVIWSMTGKNTLFNKVFTLFVDMDKLIGKDFEKGLQRLRELAEAR